jgi:hypothetical protein
MPDTAAPAEHDLQREARTARIFAEALARRRRKIARGEPVDPPFSPAPEDGGYAAEVAHAS